MQSICFLDPFISDASYVMSLIVLKLNSKLNCRCCVQQVTLYDCVWFSSPSIPSSALSAGYSEKNVNIVHIIMVADGACSIVCSCNSGSTGSTGVRFCCQVATLSIHP